MTAQRTNRLIGSADRPSGAEAYIRVNGTMIACSFEEYVAWLNKNEKRRGTWVIKFMDSENGEPPKRTVDWLGQVGSDAFLRGKGITPEADWRAQSAQPIDRYISDYGRAK